MLLGPRVTGPAIAGSAGQVRHGRGYPQAPEPGLFEREGSLTILESWQRSRGEDVFFLLCEGRRAGGDLAILVSGGDTTDT